jgi:hypothetical protein
LAKIIQRRIGLRASRDDENEGLDASMHGEDAFATADGGAHFGTSLAEAEPMRNASPVS